MKDAERWQFPSTVGGAIKGISNANVETFAKDPIKSFTREILQNSLDASNSNGEPVIVEFSTFSLMTSKLPDVDRIKQQIQWCIELQTDATCKEVYQNMLNAINGQEVQCMRISDYNTTGLIGADKDDLNDNHFLALTKGNGISVKDSNNISGGSKGVGKNAAFIMSQFRIVFYQTYAIDNCKASIGVADLVSGYNTSDSFRTPNNNHTDGTGYFTGSDKLMPMFHLIGFEGSEKREHEYGTDIYVIGFTSDKNWQHEMILSALDSFMVAIWRQGLIVKVNDVELSKETISDFATGGDFFDSCTQSEQANLYSQYALLNGEDVIREVIDIDENSEIDLFIKKFDQKEKCFATHCCSMIRTPYMKIKDIKLDRNLPVSAMCVLNKNNFTKQLLKIENPQHTDWEPKRIKDVNARSEVSSLLKKMKDQIGEKIIDNLKLGDDEPIDPEGAGDFLPDVDEGNNLGEEVGKDSKSILEDVKVTNKKRYENIPSNAVSNSESNGALSPDDGDPDDDVDGDVLHPDNTNQGVGGEPHPGSIISGKKDGDGIVFSRKKISSIKYTLISTNRENGEVRVIFKSPDNISKCYIKLSLIDDSNSKTKIDIIEAKKAGVYFSNQSKDGYGPFSMTAGEKVVLDLKTNMKDYFGSEVSLEYEN